MTRSCQRPHGCSQATSAAVLLLLLVGFAGLSAWLMHLFGGMALPSLWNPEERSLVAGLADMASEEALLLQWLERPAVLLEALVGMPEDALRNCLLTLFVAVIAVPSVFCIAELCRADVGPLQARLRAFLIGVSRRLITTHFRCEHFWLRTRGR